MDYLNLGILAHVDAGKTTLTERLLFHAGVITAVGRVDAGNTQTDAMELERRRGITITSAVVAFPLDGLTVNLVDTPGHSDFIAEVERALGVLDGAVLVLSAVEGIQAQTRVLMRTLKRLGIPTLIFVNKIDRAGARDAGLVDDIREALASRVLVMSTVDGVGTRAAAVRERDADAELLAEATEVLADNNDDLMSAFVDGRLPTVAAYRGELARQVRDGVVHPVYFGSAITGVGVAELAAGIRAYLPPASRDVDGEPDGLVFKVERGSAAEKIAYVRVRAGTLRARTRPMVRRGAETTEAKITAVRVFERGTATRADAAPAGSIAKVWGMTDVRIGDVIGVSPAPPDLGLFARPTLETVVTPTNPRDRMALHAALRSLAERDPLVDPRLDADEITVNLYGEVQKQVIAALLDSEFGIGVRFSDSRVLHIEVPDGVGEAEEVMGDDATTHFYATVGLRVAPGERGSGVRYRLGVQRGSLLSSMHNAIEEAVRSTLEQGIHGWPVTDCEVTLIRSGYVPPASTASEFRKLTPLVIARALRRAGTVVCEPISRFGLDIPDSAAPAVLLTLAELGATVETTDADRGTWRLSGTIRTAALQDIQRRLPALAGGEAAFASHPDGHRPVPGTPPNRPRTDGNPFNRDSYLRFLHNRR